MADYSDHINQAEHNEEFCREILSKLPQYYDWLITASFYAAIHYVEAAFSQDPKICHTEKVTPPRVSTHSHREELVRQKYGKQCWRSYRKLRNHSQNVRYLTIGKTGIATDYFKLSDAQNCLNNHLAVIKNATIP